jgi:hypothetical protein
VRRAAREAAKAEDAPGPGGDCDPNYEGAWLKPDSPDDDCAGGSLDGPDYIGAVRSIGSDPYDLDRDGDGKRARDEPHATPLDAHLSGLADRTTQATMPTRRGVPMRSLLVALVLFAVLAPAAAASALHDPPVAHAAAVCADYPNQAAAQRAADTVDGDGDGAYCESLPCPCLEPGVPSTPSPTPTPSPAPTGTDKCSRPTGVQPISFSKTKYPNIKRHMERAIAKGWPSNLVLNRPGADERRDRLLQSWDTRPGRDRDEYPPAVGRGRGAGLTGGSDPRGWKADVAYVPSGENRSHGSRMGIKLRRFCDGTRFRYVFY